MGETNLATNTWLLPSRSFHRPHELIQPMPKHKKAPDAFERSLGGGTLNIGFIQLYVQKKYQNPR